MTTVPARSLSSSTAGEFMPPIVWYLIGLNANRSPSLNKCGVISPRYNVRLAELEKWVVKLLPARQFGYVILTTSAGIMDQEEARRKHVAGKIIGFFY